MSIVTPFHAAARGYTVVLIPWEHAKDLGPWHEDTRNALSQRILDEVATKNAKNPRDMTPAEQVEHILSGGTRCSHCGQPLVLETHLYQLPSQTVGRIMRVSSICKHWGLEMEVD